MHFEVIGKDPERLRTYFGDLFGWEFDTTAPVAEAVSQAGNYGFVERVATSDGTGIPGGVGGGAGYDGHAIFYVGVPTSRPRSRRPRAWAGRAGWAPRRTRGPNWWSATSRTPRAI